MKPQPPLTTSARSATYENRNTPPPPSPPSKPLLDYTKQAAFKYCSTHEVSHEPADEVQENDGDLEGYACRDDRRRHLQPSPAQPSPSIPSDQRENTGARTVSDKSKPGRQSTARGVQDMGEWGGTKINSARKVGGRGMTRRGVRPPLHAKKHPLFPLPKY